MMLAAWLAPLGMAQEGSSGPEADQAAASDATPADASPIAEEDTSVQAPDPEQAAAEFTRQLLTVEEQTNALKERVFRSKATLQLLKEIVVRGATTGARSVIWHVNDLSPSYQLQSISYYLDGQSIFTKSAADGDLDALDDVQIWDGTLPPGKHTVTVSAVLQGNGFGIFSYVDGYTFKVQSSYGFTAENGQVANLRVVLREQKGLGKSFVERPTVDYELKTVRMAEME